MDSSEHGAMEQNEEHHETNISIYYMRETELYTESYDALNIGMYCDYVGDLEKILSPWNQKHYGA